MRPHARSTATCAPRGAPQRSGPAIGQRIHLALDAPITTGSVNLVQPLLDARDRFITEVVLRFDGGDEVEALLGASSRTAEGQTVAFPDREFQTLEIEITDLNVGSVQLHGNANGVGFAEVRVRDAGANADVHVGEVVRMPTDLLDAVGTDDTMYPLVLLMSRDRIDPIPPRRDPERVIAREFTLPSTRSFALTGDARVASEAESAAVDARARCRRCSRVRERNVAELRRVRCGRGDRR